MQCDGTYGKGIWICYLALTGEYLGLRWVRMRLEALQAAATSTAMLGVL